MKIHGVRAEGARRKTILIERGDNEGDREHDRRSRVTTDYLGSVDPDVAPGAEPLVDSSPGTAAAAAAACCWCGGCVGS